jgi:hypothetical protein
MAYIYYADGMDVLRGWHLYITGMLSIYHIDGMDISHGRHPYNIRMAWIYYGNGIHILHERHGYTTGMAWMYYGGGIHVGTPSALYEHLAILLHITQYNAELAYYLKIVVFLVSK